MSLEEIIAEELKQQEKLTELISLLEQVLEKAKQIKGVANTTTGSTISSTKKRQKVI